MSFINGLCQLIGVEPPHGSRTDDSQNDYVFERRVFQDNDDDSVSFGKDRLLQTWLIHPRSEAGQ